VPGPQELMVIAVVALLVFGPDRLPELARNAAKIIGRLRNEMTDSVDELKRVAGAEGLDEEWRAVRSELRGARDQLRQPIAEAARGRGAGPDHRREDDRPPPIDAEAT
jgi:sec-independent protein translocase protein TatB